MTVCSRFLQDTQLAQFSGAITYDANGFAVLPPYTIIWIDASMQQIKRGEIKFNPEGTHYADWFQFITDYPIKVDFTPNSLGDYFIYNNNTVYKVISNQDFLPFTDLSTNHVEGYIAKDNMLTYNGTVLSIPIPEIDGEYGSLFQLVAMVNSCFTAPSITTLWAFQQELQPVFPYCTITIESVENIDNTNYNAIDVNSGNFYTNISKQLIVKFSFYAEQQIQALNLMEKFKLNYVNYTLNTNLLQWIGFVEESNEIDNKLYEDRTVFNADCRMRFSWIVQQIQTAYSNLHTQSIDTVAFMLSIPPN
jgi:hypothetical protein